MKKIITLLLIATLIGCSKEEPLNQVKEIEDYSAYYGTYYDCVPMQTLDTLKLYPNNMAYVCLVNSAAGFIYLNTSYTIFDNGTMYLSYYNFVQDTFDFEIVNGVLYFDDGGVCKL